MLGGYQQDHPLVLMADTGCRVVGHFVDAGGRRLLRHNCTGAGGVSGAPLLIERGGKWYVAGVYVPARPRVPVRVPLVPDPPPQPLCVPSLFLSIPSPPPNCCSP